MRKLLSLKQFFKKYNYVILFIVITALCTFGAYALHKDLKIDHIMLTGKEKNYEIQGLNILKNKNLFFLQENDVQKMLLPYNPILKSLSIEKTYPNSLTIHLSYYTPLTYLALSDGYILLSEDGRILEKTRELDETQTSYPLMHYYQSFPYLLYHAGNYIDTHDITTTLYVLKQAQIIGLEINEIDIQSFHMIALKGKDIIVYFSAHKNKEDISTEMKKIIRQLKLNGIQFRVLNLRFERPVIEYY